MLVIVSICACEFRDRILFKGKECKTRVNLNFSKKWGKHGELAATIQVENLEFFQISGDETDLNVNFISRNQVTHANFIEF